MRCPISINNLPVLKYVLVKMLMNFVFTNNKQADPYYGRKKGKCQYLFIKKETQKRTVALSKIYTRYSIKE